MAEEEDDSLDALEYELNQMGLSVEDLQPPEDGQFDRRAMARVESARIMSRRFIERDKVKSRMSAQTKVRHFYWIVSGITAYTEYHSSFSTGPREGERTIRYCYCSIWYF